VTDRFSFDRDANLLTVGDRRFPARLLDPVRDIALPSGGRHCQRRHRVMMENGYQLSIVWGSGMHGDNYEHGLRDGTEFVEEPELVEVAVFGPGDKGMLDLVIRDGDGQWEDVVLGYMTPVEVQRLVVTVSALSTSEVPAAIEFDREAVSHE
jgi:hypothetical protein